MELDDLSKRFPFQVPSYFALILRAFSVIEGIALRADPQYSIVSETFPYLARRLLTDNSPRTRAALRQLLYGVRQPVLSLRGKACTVCHHVPHSTCVSWACSVSRARVIMPVAPTCLCCRCCCCCYPAGSRSCT